MFYWSKSIYNKQNYLLQTHKLQTHKSNLQTHKLDSVAINTTVRTSECKREFVYHNGTIPVFSVKRWLKWVPHFHNSMINWKCRLQVFLGSPTAGLWHFMIILELAKMRLSLSPFRRRRPSDKTELPMGMTSLPNNMFAWNLPWCLRSQRDKSNWMKDRGEKRTDASSERPELQINLTRPSSHPKILSHDNDVKNSQPWLAPYGPQKTFPKWWERAAHVGDRGCVQI